MTRDCTDTLIARVLVIASGSKEASREDADDMLDLLIDQYPWLAQQMLHEFNSSRPASHLRVVV